MRKDVIRLATHTQEKQYRRNMRYFPIGTFGRDMVYTMFTNFFLTYILFTRTLDAAQLSTITAITVAARIFDALNDPIMGNIIEGTRGKYGKFKPWLLIGILTTSIVTVLAFSSTLDGWAFVFFVGVMNILFSITYTMHDIAYWGMISALSRDQDDRNKYTSRASLLGGIGTSLASILIPILTTGNMTLGGNAGAAYRMVAIIISILSPLFLFITIWGVKERREQQAKPVPVSFRKVFTTIFRNDQLVWMAVIFLIQQVGYNLISGGISSTYIYFTFGYAGGLYSLFFLVGNLATAVLLITFPMLSRRFTRKALMNRLFLLSSIGYGWMIVVGLLLPTSMVKFWLLAAGFMMSNLGQHGFFLIMMISIINTVEYNEWKHGARDEAIITSLRPFLTKMGSASVALLTTVSYLLFGITRFTNQISSLEQAASIGQVSEADKLAQITEALQGVQPNQTLGLLLLMTLFPWLMMLLCHRLYQKKYTLDETRYAEICMEIEAREQLDHA